MPNYLLHYKFLSISINNIATKFYKCSSCNLKMLCGVSSKSNNLSTQGDPPKEITKSMQVLIPIDGQFK